MPRKTEIQAEEAAVASPLRRSNRSATVNTGTPTLTKTRSGLTSGNEEKVETTTVPRTRRAVSVTKDEPQKSTPAKTRTRRSSAPIEPPPSEEKRLPTSRGRRSSITEEVSEPAKEGTPTSRKSIRSRRNSAQEEKVEEQSSIKAVDRRGSATDEEPKGRTTRNTRRLSVEKTEEILEEPKRATRATRRNSVDKVEDEPEPKVSKPNTPKKSRRRLSITDTVVPMEPITEQETEKVTRKSKSPVQKESQNVKTTKKTEDKKIDLDLSVINETSFTEEAESTSTSQKSPLRKSSSPQICSQDTLVIKLTPIKKKGSSKATPPELSVISEEMQSKNMETPPTTTSQYLEVKDNLGLCLPRNSPVAPQKLPQPSFNSDTPTSHTSKDKGQHDVQSNEPVDDDSVFVDTTPSEEATNTSHKMINSGSDGSFSLHLSASLIKSSSQDSQDGEEDLSTSSDKENIAVEANMKENPHKMLGELKTLAVKLTNTPNITPKPETVTVARVSNVFQPKNVDFSFVEPMEVDKTMVDPKMSITDSDSSKSKGRMSEEATSKSKSLSENEVEVIAVAEETDDEFVEYGKKQETADSILVENKSKTLKIIEPKKKVPKEKQVTICERTNKLVKEDQKIGKDVSGHIETITESENAETQLDQNGKTEIELTKPVEEITKKTGEEVIDICEESDKISDDNTEEKGTNVSIPVENVEKSQVNQLDPSVAEATTEDSVSEINKPEIPEPIDTANKDEAFDFNLPSDEENDERDASMDDESKNIREIISSEDEESMETVILNKNKEKENRSSNIVIGDNDQTEIRSALKEKKEIETISSNVVIGVNDQSAVKEKANDSLNVIGISDEHPINVEVSPIEMNDQTHITLDERNVEIVREKNKRTTKTRRHISISDDETDNDCVISKDTDISNPSTNVNLTSTSELTDATTKVVVTTKSGNSGIESSKVVSDKTKEEVTSTDRSRNEPAIVEISITAATEVVMEDLAKRKSSGETKTPTEKSDMMEEKTVEELQVVKVTAEDVVDNVQMQDGTVEDKNAESKQAKISEKLEKSKDESRKKNNNQSEKNLEISKTNQMDVDEKSSIIVKENIQKFDKTQDKPSDFHYRNEKSEHDNSLEEIEDFNDLSKKRTMRTKKPVNSSELVDTDSKDKSEQNKKDEDAKECGKDVTNINVSKGNNEKDCNQSKELVKANESGEMDVSIEIEDECNSNDNEKRKTIDEENTSAIEEIKHKPSNPQHRGEKSESLNSLEKTADLDDLSKKRTTRTQKVNSSEHSLSVSKDTSVLNEKDDESEDITNNVNVLKDKNIKNGNQSEQNVETSETEEMELSLQVENECDLQIDEKISTMDGDNTKEIGKANDKISDSQDRDETSERDNSSKETEDVNDLSKKITSTKKIVSSSEVLHSKEQRLTEDKKKTEHAKDETEDKTSTNLPKGKAKKDNHYEENFETSDTEEMDLHLQIEDDACDSEVDKTVPLHAKEKTSEIENTKQQTSYSENQDKKSQNKTEVKKKQGNEDVKIALENKTNANLRKGQGKKDCNLPVENFEISDIEEVDLHLQIEDDDCAPQVEEKIPTNNEQNTSPIEKTKDETSNLQYLHEKSDSNNTSGEAEDLNDLSTKRATTKKKFNTSKLLISKEKSVPKKTEDNEDAQGEHKKKTNIKLLKEEKKDCKQSEESFETSDTEEMDLSLQIEDDECDSQVGKKITTFNEEKPSKNNKTKDKTSNTQYWDEKSERDNASEESGDDLSKKITMKTKKKVNSSELSISVSKDRIEPNIKGGNVDTIVESEDSIKNGNLSKAKEKKDCNQSQENNETSETEGMNDSLQIIDECDSQVDENVPADDKQYTKKIKGAPSTTESLDDQSERDNSLSKSNLSNKRRARTEKKQKLSNKTENNEVITVEDDITDIFTFSEDAGKADNQFGKNIEDSDTEQSDGSVQIIDERVSTDDENTQKIKKSKYITSEFECLDEKSEHEKKRKTRTKKKVESSKGSFSSQDSEQDLNGKTHEDLDNLKLDKYFEQKLEDLEESEEKSDSENRNNFIDDEAEEGEEDTPSEDSNALPEEEGELINTTESEWSDEDYDDDDSFICDDEKIELLSGDEYDLEDVDKKTKKRRIINVDDYDDEIIQIEKKTKPKEANTRSKRRRIITVEDSSDEDVIENERINEELKSVSTSNDDITRETEASFEKTDEDHDTSRNTSQKDTTTEDEEVEEASEAQTEDASEDDSDENESDQEVLDNSKSSTLEISKEKVDTNTSVRRASITILENIKVTDIQDPKLTSRISQLVDSFSRNISKGDVSVSLSMEYEGEKCDQTNDAVFDETNTANLSQKQKRLSNQLNLSRLSTSAKKTKQLKQIGDESYESPSKKTRLSVSLNDTNSPDAEPSTSRRSLSTDDIHLRKLRKKKMKKLQKNANKEFRGIQDKPIRKSKSANDLRAETFSLMSQLLTDVKNRPRRTLKPSSSRDPDMSWIVDDVPDVKPSTSLVKKEFIQPIQTKKIHAKDFKSQMLNDPSRVKRINTKQLLRKKSAEI